MRRPQMKRSATPRANCMLAMASIRMDDHLPRRAFLQQSVLDFFVGEIELEHVTHQMHLNFMRRQNKSAANQLRPRRCEWCEVPHRGKPGKPQKAQDWGTGASGQRLGGQEGDRRRLALEAIERREVKGIFKGRITEQYRRIGEDMPMGSWLSSMFAASTQETLLVLGRAPSGEPSPQAKSEAPSWP
eukprot:g6595.t1